jgi:hypothetical protein
VEANADGGDAEDVDNAVPEVNSHNFLARLDVVCAGTCSCSAGWRSAG